jgi:hypothetical protein
MEDSLLDALNGKDALPPMVDVPGAPAASRDAQLTVGPRPEVPAVQRADAVHSTSVGGKGYRVAVRGEYFALAAEGKGKVKRTFDAVFNLPKLDGALSVIKNTLLKPYLRAKFPDFVADRTCAIVEATPLSAATPKSNNLAYMDRAQLVEYVNSSEPRIPLDPSEANYPNVVDLRDAVIDYVQTPQGFAKREAERQSKRQAARDLAAMNPDLVLES